MRRLIFPSPIGDKSFAGIVGDNFIINSPDSILANRSKTPFTVYIEIPIVGERFRKENCTFLSMDHLLDYGRAYCFWDSSLAEKIRKTTDIQELKHLRTQISTEPRLVSQWTDFLLNSDQIVKAFMEKFKQNSDAKEVLLSTDKHDIIFQSSDEIWGKSKKGGFNLLGNLLMTVRNRFTSSDRQIDEEIFELG